MLIAITFQMPRHSSQTLRCLFRVLHRLGSVVCPCIRTNDELASQRCHGRRSVILNEPQTDNRQTVIIQEAQDHSYRSFHKKQRHLVHIKGISATSLSSHIASSASAGSDGKHSRNFMMQLSCDSDVEVRFLLKGINVAKFIYVSFHRYQVSAHNKPISLEESMQSHAIHTARTRTATKSWR